MRLVTERLIIRRFEAADWPDVLGYTSDRETMAYMPDGLFGEADAKRFVIENGGSDARNYAVVLKGVQRLIGHIVFHPWFGDHTYEIGWVIAPGFRGRGYATEAAQALLHFGFAELGLHRVIATCQPENAASSRVMERLGMRREGCFLKCIPRGDGVWWDEYVYAVLAEEWK
ncbi:GNAT family N-acetyltransferase [Cohnella phaseoli]|uniref:RimJ/RimL family protein N-acetyltransferase n=1 Tax=Cohnella phaseoli TaxID=456490 RepID=A0A3D9ICS2_9BACL|nr:GNAT family N-acetyltransferase [Cohnella phaseoli]RED59450.1 RimJ/RimL family protein N-acetyltransferase [Cohnella phaseoli]